jgi:hypothetical protein
MTSFYRPEDVYKVFTVFCRPADVQKLFKLCNLALNRSYPLTLHILSQSNRKSTEGYKPTPNNPTS